MGSAFIYDVIIIHIHTLADALFDLNQVGY